MMKKMERNIFVFPEKFPTTPKFSPNHIFRSFLNTKNPKKYGKYGKYTAHIYKGIPTKKLK